ncbi:cell envelope integrity protein TolA [soil metagenome]
MESPTDRARAFTLAVALHIGLLVLAWMSASWAFPRTDEAAAGEPIQATLQMSKADLKRAAQAVAEAEKARPPEPEPPVTPPPQPQPAPKPQVADTPPQPIAQERLDKPDLVDQQQISKLAQQPPDKPAPEEQVQKTRQDQVDLTQDQIRQRIAERRQELRAQIEQLQRERDTSAKRTRLEEQRLAQLADRQPATPTPARDSAPDRPVAGNRGVDAGLLSRYKAAMLMTADGNWNHLGVPERTHCQVRFTQLTGGEVINVEFIGCPYDVEGRETVDRALRKSPMPYAGFETVFARQVTLDFCHPREVCTP